MRGPDVISNNELSEILERTTAAFLGQEPPYGHIAEQTHKAVTGGDAAAFAMPAVAFSVDAALDALTQPHIQERLPKEIAARAQCASDCAGASAVSAVSEGTFLKFYARNNWLDPLMNENNVVDITNHRYLRTHAGAPFLEAGLAAGGALRLTRARREVAEPPADVIARSNGLLLAVAGIPKSDQDNDAAKLKELKQRSSYLGHPYIKLGNLSMRGNPPEVTFNARARQYIKSLAKASPNKPTGCPARRVRSSEDPSATVLQEYWGKIVRLLVPPDATADA